MDFDLPVNGNHHHQEGIFPWGAPHSVNNSNASSSAALQGLQEMSDTTRQVVDEEITMCMNQLRARITTILEQQQINNVECILEGENMNFADNSNNMQQQQQQQQPGMNLQVYYPPAVVPTPLSQSYSAEQVGFVVQDQDNNVSTPSSDYYTCELPDNGSDLSNLSAAHYSEEMIENRKNLYVMRILTSVIKIQRMLAEGYKRRQRDMKRKLGKKVDT